MRQGDRGLPLKKRTAADRLFRAGGLSRSYDAESASFHGFEKIIVGYPSDPFVLVIDASRGQECFRWSSR